MIELIKDSNINFIGARKIAITCSVIAICAGIISIAVFLVVGLSILLSVSEKRARQAAVEYAPAD